METTQPVAGSYKPPVAPLPRLFFFSQLCPTQNVPLHHIKRTEMNNGIITFFITDDMGHEYFIKKPYTDFIRIQVEEYINPKNNG